jgi:hypothetical protein
LEFEASKVLSGSFHTSAWSLLLDSDYTLESTCRNRGRKQSVAVADAMFPVANHNQLATTLYAATRSEVLGPVWIEVVRRAYAWKATFLPRKMTTDRTAYIHTNGQR